MLTPEPDRAMEFFGELLGWAYSEIPGLGHSISVGGKSVGGLFDLHGPNTPPGLPPVIGVMVKVESADAVCERVQSLGGRTKPAFDIGEQGRMAVCFDPNGGEFDIWEPRKLQGTEVDSTLHGAPSWFETLTTDVDRARSFYVDLLGWTPEIQQNSHGSYTTFNLGGTPTAGMMTITPEMGPVPPHWGVYFTVNDIEKSAKRATDLGATLFVPPTNIPDVGRFCGVTSPQGVRFYQIAYTR
jgi:predicted enzyme related to lactoylglutathione lyase